MSGRQLCGCWRVLVGGCNDTIECVQRMDAPMMYEDDTSHMVAEKGKEVVGEVTRDDSAVAHPGRGF